MDNVTTDPFAEENSNAESGKAPKKGTRKAMTEMMKQNERPIAVANAPLYVAPVDQTSLETYTRVSDLAPGPGFFKPEEIEGIDIVIVGATLNAGDYGDFLTLEFIFKNESENPDPDRAISGVPNVVNMGGKVAVPKLQMAIRKIQEGKASGPLVAAFVQKPMSSGQSFWDVE